jgi:hypothetical protein
MKAKKFACVEMMHQGAEKVQEKIGHMTRKEELAYWRECSRKLARRQTMTQREAKRNSAPPQ